ncbi:MAG TPA: TetR/AcrR family transcriptional regulator [Acidimicrobiales bacterium]|jgi:AcrR family transcriptional regulator|nr:TetR/AcrR family transcriptional regulator [Acidimicrobiales bacterium]
MATQAERRESTRAAFIQAAADSLRKNGLSGFTTSDVVRRAGMSNGALFRYFATRTDLLSATVQFVFARLRDEYAERYVALASTEVTPQSLLTLLWNVYDDPYLAAVYEVYGAARTDEALRAAIEPMIREHVEIIHQLAHDIVTLVSDADDDVIREMVWVAALSMQGLALSRPVYVDPYGGEQLVDTLARLSERVIDFRRPS